MSVSRAIASTDTAVARQFGVGGGVWDILTPTGDGVTAIATWARTGAWRGWVVEGAIAAEGSAATGTQVAQPKRWEAISRNAIPAPGTILRSVALPVVAFRVVALDVVAGYSRALLHAVAVPAIVPDPTGPLLDVGIDEGVVLALGMDVL